LKKVNFKSLTLENFLSYKSPQTFSFEGKGITLLLGLNGHGKSAIASGMFFALFGKSDRGSVDELVNNNTGKNLKVTLEFEINNNQYKIVRGRKPHIFDIFENNKKLNENANIKKHQKILNEILGFNETIYSQLIYLGANISNTKNFLDLSQKEKEDILNIIINISEFNNLRDQIKNYQRYIKNEIKNKEAILKILENNLQTLKKSIEEQEKQNKEIVKNKNQLLENITNEIKNIEDEIKGINKKLSKKDILIKKINEKKLLIKNLKENFETEKDKYKHIKFQIQNYYENEKSKIVCPYCGGEIKKELNINIEEIEESEKTSKEELKKLKSKIKNEELELNKFESALNKLEHLEFKKEQFKNQILKLKERYNQIEKMQEIKIDYSILENKQNEIEKVEKEYLELKNDFDDCKELLVILSEDNLKGEYISKYIPLLNYHINFYLEKLNSGFTIKFNNKFKETLYINNKEISYQSLSNGQKMRIIIAILFALLKMIESKSNINFNILFLDEFINGSLDIFGVEDTLNTLKDFSSEKEIILITHNNDIKQMDEIFSRIYEIRKNGESKIIKY